MILSIYLLIFIGLIVAAEFKKEKPRLYFDFLDNQFGRSLFITFTQLLILQKSSAVEVILSIIIFAVSLIGMFLGHDLPPDGINSGKLDMPSSPSKGQQKDRQPAGPQSAAGPGPTAK